MLPPRLRYGDAIGVVSPSTPVTEHLHDQLKHGISCLQDMGFRVVLGEHLSSTTFGYTASPREKAHDLNAMFASDSIRAIICSQGGATANACLPYLDWATIEAHPKIVLGISDITVLLNAVYARTGLVTFHGNDVLWGFGRQPTAYDLDEFRARLVDAQIGVIQANGLRRTVRAGSSEGRLLGGNLTALLKLAGTPYFPDFTDAILFLEDIGITPERCDHELTQLRQMGVFDQLQGMIVGYIDGMDNTDEPIKLEDILLRASPGFDFPILKACDFGHNCPNTTLPVGGRVRLDAGAQSIEILAPCVV